MQPTLKEGALAIADAETTSRAKPCETTQEDKTMNMAEAKLELMELAENKYHSLEYSINDHGKGSVSQTCKVYLPEYGYFEAAHWDTAIAQLKDAMNGKEAISEDLPISKADIKAA
jgi:hypothetical protein